MAVPVSLFLDGVRVRVATDAVELVLEISGHGSVTAAMTADVAERLGVVLIQAAWFAAHGGDLPAPAPPPKPRPKGRGRKGGAS